MDGDQICVDCGLVFVEVDVVVGDEVLSCFELGEVVGVVCCDVRWVDGCYIVWVQQLCVWCEYLLKVRFVEVFFIESVKVVVDDVGDVCLCNLVVDWGVVCFVCFYGFDFMYVLVLYCVWYWFEVCYF